ncbi:hypothetical protein HDU86_005737 [Geranomyces michiganensis]|nr:hypothetical protein HDU86_005737 [Geranomyces michiganensis]
MSRSQKSSAVDTATILPMTSINESTHTLSHSNGTLPPRTHRKTRHHLAKPLNNISLHIGILFTLGSIAWVINGVYTQFPDKVYHGDSAGTTVAMWGAFAGGWLFQLGAIATIIEANNTSHEAPIEDHKTLAAIRKPKSHFHHRRRESYKTLNLFHADQKSTGWKASAVQLAAATIFTVSVVTGIPFAINGMSRPLAIVVFWIPQVLGGTGFVIASLMYMKEVGFAKLRAIGWWVAAWNLVGAVGFLLCGLFGCWDWDKDPWAKDTSDINNFYGGVAFLIGSILQTIEVLTN